MVGSFSKKYSFWIFLPLFLAPHFLFWSLEETHFFGLLLLVYLSGFIGYLGLVSNQLSNRRIFTLLVVSSLPYFLSIPQLSVDFYRFLWDGSIQHQGINPFDYLPPEAIQQLKNPTCTQLDMYAGISELSRLNYTPYPSINQWYFYTATLFGGSLLFQANLLRILIFLTILLGWKFALKNLSLFEKKKNLAAYLFLNPLVIIESIGNLHFEMVMVTWTFFGVYYLFRKKWFLASIFLSIAVQIKLLPLILVPFVLRFLNWRKTLYFGTSLLILTALLFGFYLTPNNLPNFLQSIALYFQNFEFNSILLYPYINYGKIKYGWNLTKIFAPRLAQWSLFLLLSFAFYGGEITKEQLAKRWVLASMIYLVFSSTTHPWYWLFPLSLSILYPNKSILLASCITFFSYGLYATNLGIENYQACLSAMNMGWLVYAIYEFTRKESASYFSFSLRSGTGS